MSQETRPGPPPYTVNYVLPGDNLIRDGRRNVLRTSETNPLIPHKASRRLSVPLSQWIPVVAVVLLTVSTAFAIFALVFPLTSCNDPLDPDVRDRIRHEWDIERRQHQEEVSKRIDIERRWRVEDDERAYLRKQWEREVERHEREERERREKERRERLRMNMFWTDPKPHTCKTYGIREYTARLVNVPENYDHRVEACMATPIRIHGVEYKAKWCEDYGPSNMIGHWEVNQHEPDCASYWNGYKDLGCVSPGSGQRHIEHHLENLPSEGDWKEFCATTPASFLGMHFMGAQSCSKTILGAVYGQWAFYDKSCD